MSLKFKLGGISFNSFKFFEMDKETKNEFGKVRGEMAGQFAKVNDKMDAQFEKLNARLDQMMGVVVTKDDAKAFLTKDDAKNFATKKDLKQFATKKDLERFATKDDLSKLADSFVATFVTKVEFDIFREDIFERMATKQDFADQMVVMDKAMREIWRVSDNQEILFGRYPDTDDEVKDHEKRIKRLEKAII